MTTNKKKRILFICQYFYPETFRGNDVAYHFVREGHDVHVVTGVPNYPTGKFFSGYGWFKRRCEMVNGVRVTRLPIIPRGNNKIMLILNYFSYLLVTWFYILFHAVRHKYDMVFCQQLSPVVMSAPAVLYKKLIGVPLYTWVLDLWPESLTAAGGIKNKYVLGFFNYFVKSEYKHSDKILISSRSFVKSIKTYGDYENKVIYYPQWGDGADRTNADNTNLMDVLKKSGILGESVLDIDSFKVMFAGAVGEAHGFECNMQAALLTKKYKHIKWVIVGDGRKLDWVRQFVKKHGLEETVFTLGRYPVETMPLFFEKADVMLVSLTDSPLFNLYAPAKISAYMSAARPIITCLTGEGSEVVKDANCGWNVRAGDAEGLAKLVIELSQVDKAILSARGKAGRSYYDEHFDKEKCLRKLDEIMHLI